MSEALKAAAAHHVGAVVIKGALLFLTGIARVSRSAGTHVVAVSAEATAAALCSVCVCWACGILLDAQKLRRWARPKEALRKSKGAASHGASQCCVAAGHSTPTYSEINMQNSEEMGGHLGREPHIEAKLLEIDLLANRACCKVVADPDRQFSRLCAVYLKASCASRGPRQLLGSLHPLPERGGDAG